MAGYTGRPTTDEYGDHQAGYIARVPAGDIVAILETQIQGTRALLDGLDDEAANGAYAPGKWTVKDVVGHLADADRILSARALRIARGDTTPIPGWEQDDYVATAGATARSLPDLLDDLATARASTVAMLRSLPADAWTRRGSAGGTTISVRAVACVIAGHELHHRAILETRYLGAAGA